jgi:hypothetical protein
MVIIVLFTVETLSTGYRPSFPQRIKAANGLAEMRAKKFSLNAIKAF